MHMYLYFCHKAICIWVVLVFVTKVKLDVMGDGASLTIVLLERLTSKLNSFWSTDKSVQTPPCQNALRSNPIGNKTLFVSDSDQEYMWNKARHIAQSQNVYKMNSAGMLFGKLSTTTF